jgi:hypothetical protein
MHLYWGTRMQNHCLNQEKPFAALVPHTVVVPQQHEGQQADVLTTLKVLWEARRVWLIDNHGNGDPD